ncbi:MAG: collagen-like protein, partial [Acidimicrobiales bacterium]
MQTTGFVHDAPTLHGESGIPPVPPPGPRRGRLWPAAVIAAGIVGLAGVGIGAAALIQAPTRVVGPQGTQGAQGTAGPAGAPGPQGTA